jgi:hypothetical protein
MYASKFFEEEGKMEWQNTRRTQIWRMKTSGCGRKWRTWHIFWLMREKSPRKKISSWLKRSVHHSVSGRI